MIKLKLNIFKLKIFVFSLILINNFITAFIFFGLSLDSSSKNKEYNTAKYNSTKFNNGK